MLTPVEFLLARVNDLEAVARRATPGPWRYNPAKEWHTPEELAKHPIMRLRGEEFVGAGPADGTIGVAACGPADEPQSMADAHFIATWDPAFVLAWCAAVRQVVKEHAPTKPTWPSRMERGCMTCGTAQTWSDRSHESNCRTVMALLQPFADHPDFDPAWRQEDT